MEEYRLMKFNDGVVALTLCYFDQDGAIYSHDSCINIEGSSTAIADKIEELKTALSKPTVDYNDIKW